MRLHSARARLLHATPRHTAPIHAPKPMDPTPPARVSAVLIFPIRKPRGRRLGVRSRHTRPPRAIYTNNCLFRKARQPTLAILDRQTPRLGNWKLGLARPCPTGYKYLLPPQISSSFHLPNPPPLSQGLGPPSLGPLRLSLNFIWTSTLT